MSTTSEEISTSPFAQDEFRDRLRELPPSAKLVAKVLEDEAPLSQGQMAET